MRRNPPQAAVPVVAGGKNARIICSQSQQYGNSDVRRRNPRPPQRSQYFSS
jgi:hypothetical protein